VTPSALRMRTIASVIEEARPLLDQNSASFLERVYTDDTNKYAARLKQYGFIGHTRVLDAGCGFGQWSLALAEANGHVTAVDTAGDRLHFLRTLARVLGLANMDIRWARIEALPFGDGRFDAAFCYGVIFLTRWRESLAELTRVLRPGGILYLNANGLGWYKHLWSSEYNKVEGYDPKCRAGKVLHNTWLYNAGYPAEEGLDVLIEPAGLESALRDLGFRDIRCAAEGMLGREEISGMTTPPFFQGEYEGETGVYEIIAKRG